MVQCKIANQRGVDGGRPLGVTPETQNKLFIGMIPPSASEEELRALMAKYGVVNNVTILRDRDLQTSKGCGFVTFDTHENAAAAIAGLNGIHQMADGKQALVVQYADTRKS